MLPSLDDRERIAVQPIAVIDEGGEELQRSDMADDQYVPPGMVDDACLMGAYRLLAEMARKDDNAHYRAAASKQAAAIKAMIQRKNKGGQLTDLDIFGSAMPQKAIGGPRALPPTNTPLIIDMK